jgi:DNA-binding MarR family transcriptional regulator
VVSFADTFGVDLVPVVLLAASVITAFLAVRGFRQSRQALSESAVLISVIVGALTSRIETSENLILQLRSDVDSINRRDIDLKTIKTSERAEYVNLLNYLQELLTFDKRFVTELTKLKTRLATIQQTQQDIVSKPRLVLNTDDMMESLTPTEIQVIQVLNEEGPKGAPELGRRLNKSREHTARLMKKLYFEGYVDRETNHTPFRYRLSEKVRSSLTTGNESQSIAAQSEKT